MKADGDWMTFGVSFGKDARNRSAGVAEDEQEPAADARWEF